jgi:hypothetical protein
MYHGGIEELQHRVLVGKPEGQSSFERPRCRGLGNYQNES